MKDEIKRQLDEASRSLAKKMEDAKNTEARKKESQDQSYQRFLKETRPMIIAALTEIGEHLKKGGHEYKISQSDKTVDKFGVVTGAYVGIDIFPKIDKGIVTEKLENHPSISYHYSIRSKKVSTRVHEYMPGSGSGSSGPDMEMELSEVTSESVQDRVARLIKENFEKWRHFSL
ncbi:MAG: hypothetical protein ACRD5H_06855 [Nitrososphaerales archaeon]